MSSFKLWIPWVQNVCLFHITPVSVEEGPNMCWVLNTTKNKTLFLNSRYLQYNYYIYPPKCTVYILPKQHVLYNNTKYIYSNKWNLMVNTNIYTTDEAGKRGVASSTREGGWVMSRKASDRTWSCPPRTLLPRTKKTLSPVTASPNENSYFEEISFPSQTLNLY